MLHHRNYSIERIVSYSLLMLVVYFIVMVFLVGLDLILRWTIIQYYVDTTIFQSDPYLEIVIHRIHYQLYHLFVSSFTNRIVVTIVLSQYSDIIISTVNIDYLVVTFTFQFYFYCLLFVNVAIQFVHRYGWFGNPTLMAAFDCLLGIQE